MTGMTPSLVLDILIIALLAATIFYSVRLSLYLKTFRESRSELDKLVQDLSTNIDKAHDAIEGMRNTADEKGNDLQDLINQSRALSDELQFINEAGNNLAERLEKLAERNRELAEKIEQGRYASFQTDSGGYGRAASRARPAEAEKYYYDEVPDTPSGPSFNIRDPEFEKPYSADDDEGAGDFLGEDEDAGWEEAEHLQSQAEKELFAALKRKSRGSR